MALRPNLLVTVYRNTLYIVSTISINMCDQVEVEYTATETNITHTARLYITVQGCGYPPEVGSNV